MHAQLSHVAEHFPFLSLLFREALTAGFATGGHLQLDHGNHMILSDNRISRDGTQPSASTRVVSLSYTRSVILFNNSITTENFAFASAAALLQSNFYGDAEGAVVAANADSYIEADWGVVMRGAATGLVDRSYYWPPFADTLYAAIIAGPGMCW